MRGTVRGGWDGNSSQMRRTAARAFGGASGARGRGRVGHVEVELQARRLAPQILELVALTCLRGEDMKDAVEVVEDDPAVFAGAVDAAREQAHLALHLQPHLVDD